MLKTPNYDTLGAKRGLPELMEEVNDLFENIMKGLGQVRARYDEIDEIIIEKVRDARKHRRSVIESSHRLKEVTNEIAVRLPEFVSK